MNEPCLGMGAALVAGVAADIVMGILFFRRVTQEDITSHVCCFRRAEKQGLEEGVLKQCFGTQLPY